MFATQFLYIRNVYFYLFSAGIENIIFLFNVKFKWNTLENPFPKIIFEFTTIIIGK